MAQVDKEMQKIFDAYLEKFDDDFVVAANHTTRIMEREAKNLFNSMITQFYKYHTTSYIRHWEGRPGTEEGQNLFSAFHMVKKHSDKLEYFDIFMDAEDMTGGYRHHSKEQVFDYVYEGVRFSYKKKHMTWSGSYNGEHFSCKNCSLAEAFTKFFSEYEDNIIPVFMDKWRSLGWL